jgi:hypothetical protein
MSSQSRQCSADCAYAVKVLGLVTLQKPFSRGTVELNITYPDAPPVVQWNAFMNPVDEAVLAELVRFNRVH